MKSNYLCSSVFICVWAAFGITASTAASVRLVDDIGRTVELKAPAKRIVTLAPFLTELAFTAGAGESVVGVSAHSDYPPQAKSLPQVAMAGALSIEPLVALSPDLVLAWRDSIRPEDLARLATFGTPVFVTQAKRLDDVPRLLEAIGRLTGRDTHAAVADYRARIDAQRKRHANQPRVAVLLEIWHRPLTTISGPHWINEALEICGAENTFKGLSVVAPELSWEDVYLRDPPVIVGAGSAAGAEEFRANWKARSTLAAVKANRLVFVDADTIQRPSARLVEGVVQLCTGLDAVR